MRSLLFALSFCALLVPAAAAQKSRCGTPEPDMDSEAFLALSDCGYLTNSPEPENEPSFFYDIPVVFHVIENTAGVGHLSEALIQEQIDILNEDFQALPGTPGAPGTDSRIRFHLARTDPSGNPTNGITYSTNNSWFQDVGNYWSGLAWDTNRYMNIYTNAVPCCYGYVEGFASAGGLVGQSRDRIVLWWEAVGRGPTIGWPLNMGRTATHEVGHYLGLYHTFCGGCGSASDCYGTGDLICDTNRESTDTSGCPAVKNSCGSPDPIHNYMDYSDDPCLWEFTPEQVNRMRCTLRNWRMDVWQVWVPNEVVRLGSPPNPDVLRPGLTSGPRAGETWDPFVDHTTFDPGAIADHLLLSVNPTQIVLPQAGTLLCDAPFPFFSTNLSPGTPFAIAIPNDPGLLGLAYCVQVASVSPGMQIKLTNALDCVVGN